MGLKNGKHFLVMRNHLPKNNPPFNLVNLSICSDNKFFNRLFHRCNDYIAIIANSRKRRLCFFYKALGCLNVLQVSFLDLFFFLLLFFLESLAVKRIILRKASNNKLISVG